MDEQPKIVRVGRYRLTPQFVERVCKHYARKVREGVMPSAIHGGLQSPDTFGPNVNAKSAHLLDVIGAREGATERAFHEATQRFATQYGVGELPVPKFADEPEELKAEEQPQQQGQQSPESKPSKDPQGDDEGGEGDSDDVQDQADKDDGAERQSKGQGDDDGDDEEGKGDGSGESEADGEGDESESGGEGNGESDAQAEAEGQGSSGDGDGEEGDSEGQQDGGRGASESEGEEDSEDASGSTLGGGGAPEVADEPEEMDLKAQLPSIANYHERELPPPEAHPLKPLPDYEMDAGQRYDLKRRDRWAFDVSGSNQLLARLRAELMAVSRHRAYRDKDSGDVDFTKLVDLAQGTNLDRVFYTMTHAKRINTAVQILVDVSGSMREDENKKCITANALCYILCSALEKLRVPCEVLAFNYNTYVVKPWSQRLEGSLVGHICAGGGTNLPSAQASGLKSLGSRRENRLIQAVITDGDVGWKTPESTRRVWQSIVDTSRGSGFGNRLAEVLNSSSDEHLTALYRSNPRLETYAFGVGVDIPGGVFTKSVSGIQPGNMVDVIVETLGRALIRKN